MCREKASGTRYLCMSSVLVHAQIQRKHFVPPTFLEGVFWRIPLHGKHRTVLALSISLYNLEGNLFLPRVSESQLSFQSLVRYDYLEQRRDAVSIMSCLVSM